MRSALCLVVGFILLSVIATSATAQTYQWKVQSSVTDVYIRSNPNGFFVGTLYGNDSFRWKQTNGAYFWGRCGGTAQKCAWVASEYLTPGGNADVVCSGSGSTANGIASRQYLLATFAKCVNDYVPSVFSTFRACSSSTAAPAAACISRPERRPIFTATTTAIRSIIRLRPPLSTNRPCSTGAGSRTVVRPLS
jgi:hypothetical protein